MLGTIDGQLLMCSISNAKQLTNDTDKVLFDPLHTTFAKQKFSISKLKILKFKERECIACCDISGEVSVFGLDTHIIENREPLLVIKIPLPSNQIITFWDNIEYVLCGAANGQVDVLRVQDGGREVIENNLRGNGTCIELTNNLNWMVTGAFEGKFQVFRLETEN